MAPLLITDDPPLTAVAETVVVPVVDPVEPDVVVTGTELLPDEVLVVVVLGGGVAVDVEEVELVEEESVLPLVEVTGVLVVVLEPPVDVVVVVPDVVPELVPEIASNASTQTQYPPDEEFFVPATSIFKV